MRCGAVLGLFLLFLTSACAEGSSIYHNRPIKIEGAKIKGGDDNQYTARVITIDAKQRNLLATHDKEGWRICSEAAPDVFSALSASASLDADVTSRRGKAAASIAESAGTIERTQTVNLLRESMYRTCERYLSGALNKSSFVIQAARDQRTMLAVLAIEQLTRAARPSSTILAPSGTSASVANSDNAALIKQFADEKTTTQTAQSAAEVAFNAAKKTSDCDTITAAPAADPELSNWSKCVAARQLFADSKTAAANAADRLDKVVNIGLAGGATNATTTAGTSSTGQGGGAISDTAVVAVSNAVKEIALNSGFDESLMFCVGYLSDPEKATDLMVRNECLSMLRTRFNHDEAARGQLLRFDVMGVPITIGAANRPDASDTAKPILKSYLTAKGLATKERQRRVRLAAATAVQIGLIRDASEIAVFIYSAEPAASQLLLNRLREVETDSVGKSALNK